MLVELNDISLKNKGDALMAAAIFQEFMRRAPGTRFGFSHGHFPDAGLSGSAYRIFRPSISELIHGGPRRKIFYKLMSIAERLVPDVLLYKAGIIPHDQSLLLLNISGFSFSDHWGIEKARAVADYYAKLKRKGFCIVLMPKTFGPFNDERIARATKSIVGSSSLVFCRDPLSYRYLSEIGAGLPHVHLAPDYTAGVQGVFRERHFKYKGRPVIIPNFRMMDKTDARVRHFYPSFLRDVYLHLRSLSLDPFFLMHQELIDYQVLGALGLGKESELDIVTEKDPLVIKGIIGGCSLVVSSRLHGILNAFNQGVPAFGTSWSHKYRAIFSDYDCDDMLIPDLADPQAVIRIGNLASSARERGEISERLLRAKERVLKKNEVMWDMIFSELKNPSSKSHRSGAVKC